MQDGHGKPFFLIADDDPDDQLLIAEAITASCQFDVDIQYVWDGVQLVDTLSREPVNQHPQLVFVDLNMPRKDGRSALLEMKKDPKIANVPVVVLTTSNHPSDIQFCQEIGVEYFRKPNTFLELRSIVGQLCTQYLK